jgi:RHS repeat-associated protein
METPTPKASMTVPPAPSGGTTRYYVEDHLGTVRLVTDEQGAVVEWHDYEPFGVEIAPSTNVAENTHQYTGQERDAATQMDYMHFRYYGSNLGRFMKPDNVMGTAMNPQDWNLYSYVHGNPVNFNDPTGHLGVDQHQFMLPSDSIAGSAYSMFENGHISTLPDGLGDAETDSMGDPGILADNRKISTNWPAWYASAAAQQAASNNSGYYPWVQTASNEVITAPNPCDETMLPGDPVPTKGSVAVGVIENCFPTPKDPEVSVPTPGADGPLPLTLAEFLVAVHEMIDQANPQGDVCVVSGVLFRNDACPDHIFVASPKYAERPSRPTNDAFPWNTPVVRFPAVPLPQGLYYQGIFK